MKVNPDPYLPGEYDRVDTTYILRQHAASINALHDGRTGPTASRPTTGLVVGGTWYFDTTLGKPVFLKQITPSIVWVDATGATV